MVLCGSMALHGKMFLLSKELTRLGVQNFAPEPDTLFSMDSGQASYDAFKRKASLSHIDKIMHKSTMGVLIVNVDKYDIPDYIGANAFAELAVAFACRKKIYLLQGLPDKYSDEIRAWGGICLHGRLDRLVDDYQSSHVSHVDQPALF